MQIWVIDNNVPIDRLVDPKVKTGELPVDREGLQRLVALDDQVWKSDSSLHGLCKQLLEEEDDEILAFTHPQNTLRYLEESPNRPDIVFFDWDFADGKQGATSADELRALYESSFFLTQIFSTKAKDEIQRAIDANPKLKALQPLLLEVQEKGSVDLKKIIAGAESYYKKEFGALADPVRRAVTTAVENTLRELGALPIKDAMEVLGRKKDKKTGAERGTAEEIANVFATSLLSALQESAASNSENEAHFKEAAIQAVAARAKALIEEDGQILAKLKALGEKPAKLDEEHKDAVRRLLNFQMYHKPGDDFVRQGDLARVIKKDGSTEPTLLLVLNAACDLERCRKKTREILTCLVLHPLTKEVGFLHIARGENPFGLMGQDITQYSNKKKEKASDGAIFFPSVAAGADGKLTDFVGVAQEVYALKTTKIDLHPTDKLTYQSITLVDDAKIKRVCSLNFSFVPAILGQITKAMAGYGFPDLPTAEIDRLTGLIS